MNSVSVTSANVVQTCIVCDATLVDPSEHRACVIKGLEQNLFKSKAEWVKLCKPKRKRMIRMALVE